MGVCDFSQVDLENYGGVLHLYVAPSGDDTNLGRSAAAPMKTLAAVWARVPTILSDQVVIHLGAGSYAYTPPPKPLQLTSNCGITLYGDGAGQAGEDGFTQVATGTLGAGTTAISFDVTVAAPVANAWRGLTVEITSGAALGHRKLIRDNTTTAVVPIVGCAYPATPVNPGTATYRILQPSVTLDLSALEQSSYAQLCEGQGSGEAYGAFSLVNVNLNCVATTSVITASNSYLRLMGVRLLQGRLYLLGSHAVSGLLRYGNQTPWFASIGKTFATDSVLWAGWGISHATTSATQGSVLVSPTGSFRGSLVCGTFRATSLEVPGSGQNANGYVELHGFSALGSLDVFGYRVQTGAPTGTHPSLVMQRLSISSAGALEFATGQVVDIGPGAASQPLINVNQYGIFRSFATINAVGTIGTFGLQVTANSQAYLQGTTNLTPVSGQIALSVSFGGSLAMAAGSMTLATTNADGLRVQTGGRLAMFAASFSSVCTTAGRPVYVTNSQCVLWAVAMTLTGVACAAQCDRGGLLDLQDSTTITATASAGPALLVRSNGQVNLAGAAHSFSGSTYGCDAQGGGRVTCTAQPTGLVGVTADLIVGAGGGESGADTLLTAAFSHLTSGASSIFRSA